MHLSTNEEVGMTDNADDRATMQMQFLTAAVLTTGCQKCLEIPDGTRRYPDSLLQDAGQEIGRIWEEIDLGVLFSLLLSSSKPKSANTTLLQYKMVLPED